MEIMKNNLSDSKREFMRLIAQAENGEYLAVLALFYSSLGCPPFEPLTGYTADDYHKALAALDRLNTGNREYAAYYGPAAAFIRREWLHEEVNDHG